MGKFSKFRRKHPEIFWDYPRKKIPVKIFLRIPEFFGIFLKKNFKKKIPEKFKISPKFFYDFLKKIKKKEKRSRKLENFIF